MIDTICIKIFLIIVLVMFLIGFLWPLILVKKKGKDPHGTHEGASILTRLSSLSTFIWLAIIITFLIINDTFKLFIPFPLLINDIIVIIGFAIIIIGFIFEILGISALGINFRIELPKDDTELITSGIYRVMRNPIVFGVFLFVIGTFLVIPNLITLLNCLFNIFTFNSKVKDEENYLKSRFGKPYLIYLSKVGRYSPFKFVKNLKIENK